MANTELLFVMGAPKTCSSTVLGLLNCHKDIFITPELFQGKKVGKNWQYYEQAFGPAPHFKPTDRMADIYTLTYDNIKRKSRAYSYFGTKYAKLDDIDTLNQWMNELCAYKTVFTVRDVCGWLAHRTIRQKYKLEQGGDCTQWLVRYIYYFVKSFQLNNRLVVRLDDFVDNNTEVLQELDAFLPKVKLLPSAEKWWDKIGRYSDQNKQLHKWWSPHGKDRTSSFTKPEHTDLDVLIKDHEVWDELLPMFDSYYRNHRGITNYMEVKSDLAELRKMADGLPKTKIEDLYEEINEDYL